MPPPCRCRSSATLAGFRDGICCADAADAVAPLESALTGFVRLGAVPDGDAAAALLRLLGVRGRTGPKDVGLLSWREQEVLRLIGLGLSNPAIAERLFISRPPRQQHPRQLGLRNRTEAAAIARLFGDRWRAV